MALELVCIDPEKLAAKELYEYFSEDYNITTIEHPHHSQLPQSIITMLIDHKKQYVNDNENEFSKKYKFIPDVIISSQYTSITGFPSSLIVSDRISLHDLGSIISMVARQKENLLTNKSLNLRLTEVLETNEELHKEREYLLQLLSDINKKKQQYEKEQDEFYQELHLAGELQKGLLPKAYPFQDKVSFNAFTLPCAFIGGDFFDVKQINEKSFIVTVVDVSGHGIRSAILAAMAKALFEKNMNSSSSPAEILSIINREFLNMIFTEEDFLTCIIMKINLETMQLTYVNAAHPHPLIQKYDGSIQELSQSNMFVGLDNNVSYKSETIDLEIGDRIILYTDGILEVKNDNKEDFGKERLYSFIEENAHLSSDALENDLLHSLLFYSGDPEFSDDLSMIIISIL